MSWGKLVGHREEMLLSVEGTFDAVDMTKGGDAPVEIFLQRRCVFAGRCFGYRNIGRESAADGGEWGRERSRAGEEMGALGRERGRRRKGAAYPLLGPVRNGVGKHIYRYM